MDKVLIKDQNGVSVPLLRLGATPVILTSADGSSVASASAISATADIICRFTSSADCFITTAASPTATTSHVRLWANQTEYFIVPKGHKVAYLAATASVLNIVPQD